MRVGLLVRELQLFEMSAVAQPSSDLEVRSIIRFLYLEKNSPIEIHRRLVGVCGPNVMSVQHVRKWCRFYKEGREEVNMSISDFRRKKLKYVFNVFFDVNHSGNIDRKDFEIAVQQVCTMRGWNENSPNFKSTKERMMSVWEGLQKSADDDQDGQVSLDEWCTMWEAFARNPESASEWQNNYMDLMFDIIDTSGDGCIDENEFCTVCDHYGISRQESSTAYKKYSNNGAVKVTRTVFHSYWREYFSSDDENAPGNFIFGKTSFD